jgi:hypothetical protein
MPRLSHNPQTCSALLYSLSIKPKQEQADGFLVRKTSNALTA